MLRVDNLVVHYGKLEILHGVSIDAAGGEITVMVGSNGAGKSTVLRAITGFVPASSGKTLLNEDDITNKPPYQIVDAGISFVDEGVKTFPYMNVIDNLMLGAYKKKAWPNREKNLKRVFQLFPRLEERLNQEARTLSGGERRMLGIARGLMAEPDLLMLDEPSSGLAPILVMSVFEAIENINHEGISILLVEQNVWESLSLGTTGYVIENGSISLSGNCDDLLANPEIRAAYLRV